MDWGKTILCACCGQGLDVCVSRHIRLERRGRTRNESVVVMCLCCDGIGLVLYCSGDDLCNTIITDIRKWVNGIVGPLNVRLYNDNALYYTGTMIINWV